MLVLTPALLYALLFSSVPVLSHLIARHENSAVEGTQSSASSTAADSNVVRISIKIDPEDLIEASRGGCDSRQNSCGRVTTNRYGLKCGKKFFNQAQILSAAKAACPRISKNSQRHRFPAPYIFSTYEKPGPYVQWPIKRDGWLWNMGRTGKYRLVMTMDCSVVGGVIRGDDDDDDDDDDYEEDSSKGHGIGYRQCKYRKQ